ncbi:MAG TPA: tetrathionate reductase family octaheme c-type cytochrome [Aestuariivirga sp.]|nr:tetrathionate reductase family octaheme c-type cytochrome [Aestuariivirga sp.]
MRTIRHWLAAIGFGFALAMAGSAFSVKADDTAYERPEGKPAAELPHVRLPVEGQGHGTLQGGTGDHSKMEALKGPFADTAAVTKACLSCHTEAGKHILKTTHWTWEFKNKNTGQTVGKQHVINNFCTNAKGNEGMCAQCHIGNGWQENTAYDFSRQDNIDCLICHDRTNSYYRLPQTHGHDACGVMFEGKQPIDFAKVAQNVGTPTRDNCGSCHYNGGGGDGVKHGDLDSSLNDPPKALDVHMAKDGGNFACTKCHVTDQHNIAGGHYQMVARDTTGTGKPGQTRNVATCESCHGMSPHEKTELIGIQLNTHATRVACQTCHIPEMARGGVATMIDWDWATAGKMKDGKGYFEEEYKQGDGKERHTYWTIKGDFKWGENVKPSYKWFNGDFLYTMPETQFDPAKAPIAINEVLGDPRDPKSRIWPFKEMHTNQPYDAGNNTLAFNHLWGKDDTAYWGNFNMEKSIAAGMMQAGRPYSGKLGYIRTVSNWPITHMVAPKQDAMKCVECHAADGRLAGLPGVYMPGRDHFRWLDILGFLGLGLTILGITVHGVLRYVMVPRPGEETGVKAAADKATADKRTEDTAKKEKKS